MEQTVVATDIALTTQVTTFVETFKATAMKKMRDSRKPGLPMVLLQQYDRVKGRQAIVLSNTGLWLYPTIYNSGRQVPDWFVQSPPPAPDEYWGIHALAITRMLKQLGL